jgi:hypothetical protein
VIFLINNGGYTIERGYMGKTSDYNDIARWSYGDLPRVFRPDTSAQSFVVKTVADLERALNAPNDRLVFVESVMDPHDAPAAVIHSSNNGAELERRPPVGPRPARIAKGTEPDMSPFDRPKRLPPVGLKRYPGALSARQWTLRTPDHACIPCEGIAARGPRGESPSTDKRPRLAVLPAGRVG